MIRSLEVNEIKSIYNAHIKKDFPRNERRPYHLLKKLHYKGRYLCFVYEEEDKIIAYATFIYDEGINNVLLDHFAVDERYRGCGIGGKLLSLVREYWNEKTGIIIECETPDSARNEKEKELRKRRIGFYMRADAKSTPIRRRIFGVDYDILWIPSNPEHSQPDVGRDLAELYALSLPLSLRPLFIRVVLKNRTKQAF